MADTFEHFPLGVGLLAAPADLRDVLDALGPDPFAGVDPFDLPDPLHEGRDPADLIDEADVIDDAWRVAFPESIDFARPIGDADLTLRPLSGETPLPIDHADATPDAMTDLRAALDEAERAQHAVNREMAAHLAACRAALDIAARNPSLYLHASSLGDRDASELSGRAAATELSMRLHLPMGTIRNRAHEATALQDRLPRVWSRFRDGAVAYTDARIAVDAAAGFATGDARLVVLDDALAAVIGTVTTARFRQRTKTVRAGLDRDEQPARHAHAFTDRRVVAEYTDDGMGWLNLYTSQVEIAKIIARVDATARRDAGAPGETRSLDQLRADSATAWLTGAATPTAARTEIIVTVPMLNLHVGGPTDGFPPMSGTRNEFAMLEGVGPIDDVTALRLLGEASSFLRLATDPITAAPLALDRTRYRPTKAQRLWLALVHERCTRTGCNRLAISTDIDHRFAWADGGRTDADNLCPLCRGDHVLKHCSLFIQTVNADETVTWTSPTGRSYTDPPPF